MNISAHKVIRLGYAVLTGLYIWFVSLQFNDVDAPLWIVGYGIAAVFSSAIAFDIRPRALRIPIAIYCLLLLVWILTLLPEIHGMWWDGEVEREVGGLSIVLLSQLFAHQYLRKMSRF